MDSTPPPSGITRTTGICSKRVTTDTFTDNETDTDDKDDSTADVAFRISNRTVASVPTAGVFPDGFPTDFSILATFRALPRSKSMLFTIYSSEGDEVLALKVARRLRLTYQGGEGGGENNKRRLKFGFNLADGK